MKFFLTAMLFATALAAGAQEAPKTADLKTPALKESVALEIKSLQLTSTQIALRVQTMLTEYKELQNQSTAIEEALKQSLSTALSRSDIDPEKYVLNPQTLAVTPKPAIPSPATK